jgi:hypothetical protein
MTASVHCAHCKGAFSPSPKQAKRVKYEHANVYCSTTCRLAMLSLKFSRPVPERGPCPTCGGRYLSRTEKMFCSLKCYIASPNFKEAHRKGLLASTSPEAIRKRVEKQKTGGDVPCLECGTLFYKKLNETRKYCSTPCYRAHFARRYDRWVANPESVALPQCYDEFLDQEELTCVVADCGWKGKHLTMHMNQAHGIPAKEFKRAAGFNLGTGVISKPLAQALQKRGLVGAALMDLKERSVAAALGHSVLRGDEGGYVRYRSLEAGEHQVKARAELLAMPGPMRVCIGCGTEFQQKHSTGRALYCTEKCRDKTYRQRSAQSKRAAA